MRILHRSTFFFFILIGQLAASELTLPGTSVSYLAGKIGWEGVVETPKFRPKMHPINPSETYTLSYSVYFKEGFEWVLGGKLPGLGGGSNSTGCVPVDPYGWSIRLMWKKEGKAILYLYDQNRIEACGEESDLNYKFEIGKLQKIVLKIKINTPGLDDGQVSVWINNQNLKILKNLKLRGNVAPSEALIDTFMFSTFYGGQTKEWAPSKNTEAIFGDFYLSN